MMLKIILLILMVGFVSAVEVELNCPDDVYTDGEFECEVEVFDGDGVYDLKIEVDGERNSVLRIWNGEDWQSGYYYVNDFVRNDADVLLKILEEGRYDVVVKLRQGDNREEFDVGRIYVKEKEGVVVDDVDLVEGGDEVIFLGGDVVVGDEEEWDYISKDGRIVDWLIYGFSLFLIFLIGALLWSR